MQVYKVIDSPVLVRKIASAESGIVNVLPVGSKLYVLGEESGWYRTTSGYYVFKTDNIVLDSLDTSPKLMMTRSAASPLRATSPSQTQYSEYMNDVDVGGIPDEELNKAWEEEAREKTKLAEEDRKSDEEAELRKRDTVLTDAVSGSSVKAIRMAVIDPTTGEPMVDEYGDYVWKDTPPSMQGNNSDLTIQYVTSDGEILVAEDKDGKKYYIEAGSSTINEKQTMDEVREEETKKSNEEFKKKIQETINKKTSVSDIISSLSGSLMTEVAALNKVTIDDARTVFGMPYQFLPIVDPRLAEDNPNQWDKMHLFGRKYKEKIVARAPILVMQPGLPVFLKGFSDDIKNEVMQNIFNVGKSELDEVVASQGQLYAFELRARDYFYAVNTACRAVAVYLGIANVEVPNLTRGYTGKMDEASEGNQGMRMSGVNSNALGNMNWSLHPEHPFGGYYAGASYFYINSDAQVSENFSTATRQSELAGKLNQISDAAMEALFLGGIGGKNLGNIGKAAKETAGAAAKDSNAAKGMGEKINEYGSDLGGAMGSIVKNIGALISGGKMSFPEIWQDSQVGRSYNVTIKLDSPDSDKVSIYLNILVPLIHILGFVMPRFAASNTYITPFLVRCFYKSMFHIDMGMISSCDIVKGDMGCWTQDGLPTQIIVSLSIKDLYSVLSQSTNYGNNTILSNPAQMEYLASMCGISVAPANISRSLELWYTLKGVNRLRDQIMDAYNAMMQVTFSAINNVMQPTRWQN